MPRSVLVYLADITGACEAIARFLAGVDDAAYREAELTSSAVLRRSRWISGAACLVAAAALIMLAGCSTSSEQPPKQWDKVTSGRLSGAQPGKVFLGTYHLGSEVRLAWVLSGPTDPRVALSLRVDNAGTAASYTNTIFSPKDGPPRRSDNALGFIDIATADYHVYFIQRFRSGRGPGFNVTYTLFTRGYVSGATPTGL